MPAGLNAIVGLKPTLGAISTRGVVPACRTLDCVSVFALTVEDAFDAFTALAGFDAAMARQQLHAGPVGLAVGGEGVEVSAQLGQPACEAVAVEDANFMVRRELAPVVDAGLNERWRR